MRLLMKYPKNYSDWFIISSFLVLTVSGVFPDPAVSLQRKTLLNVSPPPNCVREINCPGDPFYGW